MMRIVEDVFRATLKRKYGSDDNVDVIINPDKGDLEIWLNREIVKDEDFELQVSSPGIDQPFMVQQQYLKNVGRNVTVTTLREEIISGELIKADQKEISIKEIKTEKNKLTSKKQQVETIHQLLMSEVRETKLIISF
jgi:ribosome maturation factor RimP